MSELREKILENIANNSKKVILVEGKNDETSSWEEILGSACFPKNECILWTKKSR